MNKDYIIFQENGLFGAKNQTGEIIIEPQYIEMQPFSCGLSQVRNDKYQYAYINADNKQVVPFGLYAWCDPCFILGFARVKRNNKWGIVNTLGQTIIPVVCDNIWTLKEEYIHAIKVVYKGKEHNWDINAFLKGNILDGLVYHRTYSVEDIKDLFGVSRIEVKQDRNTGKLFFTLSTITGEVALKEIPQKPVISIVSNVNGRLFPLLHEAEDTGKTSFYSFYPSKSIKQSVQANKQSVYYDEDRRDYMNDWKELMDDAFEGDASNYWNID